MLNNECHSVLTYQPIWFYSHVSAAVEKIDIISKHTKTTIWGGGGGDGDVIISDLLTCLCYYDNTFLSSQQS